MSAFVVFLTFGSLDFWMSRFLDVWITGFVDVCFYGWVHALR